jgi:hypothetical protein
MALKRITFEHEDGSIRYLESEELNAYNNGIKELIETSGFNPFTNLVFKDFAPEYKLQRVYFAMVEELAKNTGSGQSKMSLHEALKPMLFSKLQDNVANFHNNVVEHSTKNLTHTGWVNMIEQLKEFAQDIFGYVLR